MKLWTPDTVMLFVLIRTISVFSKLCQCLPSLSAEEKAFWPSSEEVHSGIQDLPIKRMCWTKN